MTNKLHTYFMATADGNWLNIREVNYTKKYRTRKQGRIAVMRNKDEVPLTLTDFRRFNAHLRALEEREERERQRKKRKWWQLL